MAFIQGSIANKIGTATNETTKKSSGFIPGSIANKAIPQPSINKKVDLGTIEGLQQRAEDVGVGKEASEIIDEDDGLGILQRLVKGVESFNPAEALLTAQEKGLSSGISKYGEGIVKGIGSAITGKDLVGERRMFKDVASEMGIENAFLKGGIGFIGDVLLDPGTYFGGAIAKGLIGTTKGVSKLALKGVEKASPEIATRLKMLGTGLEEAAGRAFVYGYKATKGAADDIASFLSRSQQAKLGLAESNLNRLGTGVLTPDQQQELALKLIAGKREEFLARTTGVVPKAVTSADPLVQKTITEQAKRTSKFAGELGLENPYETYFPFIKKEKLDGFIKNVGSSKLRVGSEGYLKQFKNVMTNEAMETNPVKAFFTSESQQVANRMTRDFLNGFVKKYGKGLDAFENADDALKNGYQIIKEKGLLGKPIGYVNKYDGALIRDAITPEFQTINMLAKATGFDAATSLFKRAVTGLFAPFHIRNYTSGHIQNFEVLGIDALNPKNINIGQKIAYIMGKGKPIPKGTLNIAGKSMKFDDVMKPFVDRFSGDTFYNADFDYALKSGSELSKVAKTFSKERLLTTAKTLGFGQEAIPFKVGRAVGQFIEHSQKATAYITALNQGKTIQQALKLAEVAGFDYRALTSFESQILRRLIPFYSFTRKNIELQLLTLGESPQRINQVIKFFENAGTALGGGEITEEERKYLPDYIQESIGVKLPDTADGLKQYISSFGTPIEAFTQLFSGNPVMNAISMTNPILKAPIEIGIGKDSFRERDLKDVYQANEYKLMPQVVKDILDIREVEKPVYKTVNGKSVKTGTKTEYQADPVKLLIARSLFTSRGISYFDQIFGDDMKGLVKFLKTTTGLKPQTINLETQKYFKELETKRDLEDLLNRIGAVKKYQNIYIPSK